MRMWIYDISQFHTPHENAEELSFPMIYHTMVYILYENCARPFNNKSIFVTMVIHNFPPKWFPWQPNNVTCRLYHCGPECEIWWRLGLNWRNYRQKLFRNIISNFTWLYLKEAYSLHIKLFSLKKSKVECCHWPVLNEKSSYHV